MGSVVRNTVGVATLRRRKRRAPDLERDLKAAFRG